MAVLTVEDVDEGMRKETKYDDLPGVSKSSICIKSGFREEVTRLSSIYCYHWGTISSYFHNR